eukprot:4580174-Amphidinium_carterae.1
MINQRPRQIGCLARVAEVCRLFPAALASLPNPLGNLLSDQERQRLIQQFKMEKMDRLRCLSHNRLKSLPCRL